jgi:protein ImuB
VIACILIDGFELRAALLGRPALMLRPAALSPVAGEEPLLGPVTAVAEAAGVRSGMRMGEALATCPALVLVDRDPARAEQEWEALLRRLEDVGLSIEPSERGTVYFDTRGVERLYGGPDRVLAKALKAVGPEWDPRAGGAARRFAALAAASVARPGQALLVNESSQARELLAPLPLELLPLQPRERAELRDLGVRRLGELAALPEGAVAERLSADGREAWELARGGSRAKVQGRKLGEEIVESLAFPEAVANELTLRRAFAALLDRVLERPERGGRFIRKLALTAQLVGGGSWRRTATLREPSAEPAKIKAALAPKLVELPAPVVELRLELVALAEEVGEQLELLQAAGAEVNRRLRQGLRQVRASTGPGSVGQVVEVAPWSRIPEARALVVPRDD